MTPQAKSSRKRMDDRSKPKYRQIPGFKVSYTEDPVTKKLEPQYSPNRAKKHAMTHAYKRSLR